MTRLSQILDQYAVANWRVAYKLWSVRLSIFWAVVSGLWEALPVFQDFLPPSYFVGLCIAFALAILFARITHQPGLLD